jgi:hypothetical protein
LDIHISVFRAAIGDVARMARMGAMREEKVASSSLKRSRASVMAEWWVWVTCRHLLNTKANQISGGA